MSALTVWPGSRPGAASPGPRPAGSAWELVATGGRDAAHGPGGGGPRRARLAAWRRSAPYGTWPGRCTRRPSGSAIWSSRRSSGTGSTRGRVQPTSASAVTHPYALLASGRWQEAAAAWQAAGLPVRARRRAGPEPGAAAPAGRAGHPGRPRRPAAGQPGPGPAARPGRDPHPARAAGGDPGQPGGPDRPADRRAAAAGARATPNAEIARSWCCLGAHGGQPRGRGAGQAGRPRPARGRRPRRRTGRARARSLSSRRAGIGSRCRSGAGARPEYLLGQEPDHGQEEKADGRSIRTSSWSSCTSSSGISARRWPRATWSSATGSACTGPWPTGRCSPRSWPSGPAPPPATSTSGCAARRPAATSSTTRPTGPYSLTPEQAFALADPDGAVYAPGAFQLALGALQAEPQVAEAFRTGAGLGWHEHDDEVFVGLRAVLPARLHRQPGRRPGCPPWTA